jgi:PAS domain S-box-containing protein
MDKPTNSFHHRLHLLNTIVLELTKPPTLDQLAHDAVEAGIRRLGFDRMGLGFFDETGEYFEGAYGTDERGHMRDEHHTRFPIQHEALMDIAIRNHSTFEYAEDAPLYDGQRQVIARGWNALALLWDGSRALGWISVDNLLHHRPLTPEDFDILNLYGTSLGHLCALKRSEQALMTERNLLRTVINAVDDYIYVKDTRSRFTLVNTASWKSSRRAHSEADMIGKTDFEFFPPELAQQYYDGEQQMLQTGQPITDLLEPNVTVEGEPAVMLTSKVPLKNDQGQIIGLVGISRDVTNYVRAQQQVQANEARFKLITEMATASNIGVVMGDHQANIHQANDAFLQITGYERADLLQLNLTVMTPPEYLKSRVQEKEPGASSKVTVLEKELLRKDGSQVPVLQVGNFGVDSAQDFIFFVIDLTLQHRLEAERLDAALHKERSTLLTEFISNLSHDLKTPLTIIQTSLHLLERLHDPMQQKAKIQTIRDQTLLLEKLIQSVLTMSRLDGDYSLSFRPLDLNQVMTELERSLRPAAERKSQILTLDLYPELPLVNASESEIYRVMVNLVENALNYTPEAGLITLRTYQDNGMVIAEVQDTGIGIEPAILPHIFDRFIRGLPPV